MSKTLTETHRPRDITLVQWLGKSLRRGAMETLDLGIKRAGQAPTAELLISTPQWS